MKFSVCPFCQSKWKRRKNKFGDRECRCGAFEVRAGANERSVFITRGAYQIAWYENDTSVVWKDGVGVVHEGSALPFDITGERLEELLVLL